MKIRECSLVIVAMSIDCVSFLLVSVVICFSRYCLPLLYTSSEILMNMIAHQDILTRQLYRFQSVLNFRWMFT